MATSRVHKRFDRHDKVTGLSTRTSLCVYRGPRCLTLSIGRFSMKTFGVVSDKGEPPRSACDAPVLIPQSVRNGARSVCFSPYSIGRYRALITRRTCEHSGHRTVASPCDNSSDGCEILLTLSTAAKRPFWPNFLEVHFGSCPSHLAEALRTPHIRKPVTAGVCTLGFH
jgi:hypothetical protein